MADDTAAPKSRLLDAIGWLVAFALVGASFGVLAIDFGIQFHVDPETGDLARTGAPPSPASVSTWAVVGFVPLLLLVIPRGILAWLVPIGAAVVLWIAVSSASALNTATGPEWSAMASELLTFLCSAMFCVGVGLIGAFPPRQSSWRQAGKSYLAAGAAVMALSCLVAPYIGKLAFGERLDMDAVALSVMDIGAGAGWLILLAPLMLLVLGMYVALALGGAALIANLLRLGRKPPADPAAQG